MTDAPPVTTLLHSVDFDVMAEAWRWSRYGSWFSADELTNILKDHTRQRISASLVRLARLGYLIRDPTHFCGTCSAYRIPVKGTE